MWLSKRIFFTIALLLVFTFNSLAQKKCGCAEISELIYNCRPIKLKSGSKLYWNYNCDSAKLIFENKRKKILYSSYLDPRIGYQFAIEYKNIFLIQNNVISGCCSPPEFITFNSHTGNLLKNYGRIIYYSKKVNDPLLIKFKDSDYTEFYEKEKHDLSLQLINPESSKTILIKTNQKILEERLRNSEEFYPEYIVNDVNVDSKIITITYRFKDKGSWKTEKMTISRAKYNI